MNHLDEIDRVFRMEIETLARVRENLDDSYAKALELLLRCTGKVVVSGTGKSGIIAHKIASTLSSTGTPALFLDPGSGMHGDVGILQTGDLLLAISKSGETEELMSMLLYVKKLSVPVICITTVRESSLGKNSDQVLWTPVDEEACPLNLAPTSSTTAALVVGDALAMVVLQLKGFQEKDFAALHPGGTLGTKLSVRVADVMITDEYPLLGEGATIKDSIAPLAGMRGTVPVVDEDRRITGVLTAGDLTRLMERDADFLDKPIGEIMTRDPKTAGPEELGSAAVHRMETHGIMALPVEDEAGRLVGIVHLHDLMRSGVV